MLEPQSAGRVALHRDLIDEIRTVDDATSFAAVREPARALGHGRVVVTLFPDGFER